jgi:hypothetical protein
MGVLFLSYVYLLYYVLIAVVTVDAGLLARSQYSEGPVTSHLDTGVDLNVNLLVISFIYSYTCKITTAAG